MARLRGAVVLGFDADFSIDKSTDGHTVVRLAGELDVGVVADMSAALATAVESSSGRLVVDMTGVTFMGSSALGVLLRTYHDLRGVRPFVVTNASPIVRRVFEVSGLDELLDEIIDH